MKINLGTKGFVRFVDVMGNDLTVVNAARVSFNKEAEWAEMIGDEQILFPKDERLINYLAKHNHWTPFGHPQITLYIKAPFPIRTQFFKHKVGFVENEVSRRYVDDVPEYFNPRWSYRPEKSIKQGSGDYVDTDTQNRAYLIYSQAVDMCDAAYRSLLELNIAPEQARMVLPLGTYTEWWWTGSLAAYARFYNQRSDPHAQAEIQEYAEAIASIIVNYFPISWKALTNKDVQPE